MRLPRPRSLPWCLLLFLHVTTHGVMAALPPLSPSHQDILQTAVDEADVPDAAFEAMSAHVLQSGEDQHDEPIRLSFVVDDLLDSPGATRGELYRVEGRQLQQRTMLAPHQDIVEWFLRMPSGEPVIVYLPLRDARSLKADGKGVTVDARFYKVVAALARDQQLRRYPAFFGRSPRLLAESRSVVTEQMDILLLLGFLALLVIIGLALIAYARRQVRREPHQIHRPLRAWPASEDDPAEALRELRSQSKGNQSD
ncbi:MAG: hypothetical protein CMJ29_08430 [Phycisphaerae bacterium]|nr:hypothetical protein [Phycisphaerae bacterium]